jgi:sialate O-acetylesterase
MAVTLLRRVALAAAVLALAGPAARADVKPHPLFSDHAVLQRGKPIPVWGTADPGEAVTVKLQSATATATAGPDGTWMVKLPEQAAGGPYELTLSGKNRVTLKDVMVGEVWVASGQSNMEWPLQKSFEGQKAIEGARNPMIRLFTVRKIPAAEPQKTVPVDARDKAGMWLECAPETVPDFSAVAYYFGRDLQKALNVPVGLIHTSWGGTPAQAWTTKEALEAEPALKHYPQEFEKRVKDYDPAAAKERYEASRTKWQEDMAKYREAAAKAKEEGKPAPTPPRRPNPPASPDKSPNSPSVLFNGMIAPLIPYAIEGAIWYQGESNAGQAYEYRTLFPAMIADWRKHWHEGDFPFLCVQLAPYWNNNSEAQQYAELREAQWLATKKLPNVGMAVITDVGEEKDIHPTKKERVGARLALLARKIAYGEKIVASGPEYKSMKVEGNRAVLSFDNVGAGLEARGGPLTGFTIAGPDHKFHQAMAEIRGETVVVSSPEVEQPVAVRYGFQNFMEVNLWNKDSLPATPFRTDDFPGVTQPKATTATGGK